jgi:hypothetical protein
VKSRPIFDPGKDDIGSRQLRQEVQRLWFENRLLFREPLSRRSLAPAAAHAAVDAWKHGGRTSVGFVSCRVRMESGDASAGASGGTKCIARPLARPSLKSCAACRLFEERRPAKLTSMSASEVMKPIDMLKENNALAIAVDSLRQSLSRAEPQADCKASSATGSPVLPSGHIAMFLCALCRAGLPKITLPKRYGARKSHTEGADQEGRARLSGITPRSWTEQVALTRPGS